jgi:hypothetical protein
MTKYAAGSLACTLLAALIVGGAQLQARAEDAGEESPSVEAFWNAYEFDFAYQGFTTHYSCDGLRDKVRYMLEQIGAREGFKVRARGCGMNGGPTRFPRVRITAALPMAATTANLAELEKDADRRELIARVRGESADLAEVGSRFAARVEVVHLASKGSRRLDAGDCELLEQVRDHLLPKLGLEVKGDDLNCIPHQMRIGEVSLDVRTLKAIPPPDAQGDSTAGRSAPRD